jgi:hypothetical protein
MAMPFLVLVLNWECYALASATQGQAIGDSKEVLNRFFRAIATFCRAGLWGSLI